MCYFGRLVHAHKVVPLIWYAVIVLLEFVVLLYPWLVVISTFSHCLPILYLAFKRFRWELFVFTVENFWYAFVLIYEKFLLTLFKHFCLDIIVWKVIMLMASYNMNLKLQLWIYRRVYTKRTLCKFFSSLCTIKTLKILLLHNELYHKHEI